MDWWVVIAVIFKALAATVFAVIPFYAFFQKQFFSGICLSVMAMLVFYSFWGIGTLSLYITDFYWFLISTLIAATVSFVVVRVRSAPFHALEDESLSRHTITSRDRDITPSKSTF